MSFLSIPGRVFNVSMNWYGRVTPLACLLIEVSEMCTMLAQGMVARSSCRSLRLSLAVVALVLIAYCAAVTAQGLQGVKDFANVGAGNTFSAFDASYTASKSVQRAWTLQRKSNCVTGGATLCTADEQTGGNVYSTLLIATSPTAFDASKPSDTGGFSCIGPARDQMGCNTCTAMVAVGAAEAAVACVLRIDGGNVRLSEQDEYFCGLNAQRTCEVGWTIPDTVNEVVSRGNKLLKQSCLPYRPDPTLVMSKEDLCKAKCKDVDPYASQGTFRYVPIGSYWAAQRHIRQYGSVITRIDINWTDFRSFFAKDPSGIYPGPKSGILPDTAHAVICHGYNNDQDYWVCLNSWGSKFGDKGSFKIKFWICNMMVDGETFGITWTPKDESKVASIAVPIAGQPDCYSYTARPGDSISSIAIRMWGQPTDHPETPIQHLLQDNRDVIIRLEDPIAGKTLKVCKPRPEAIRTTRQPTEPTGQCTASQLTTYGVQFTGPSAVGKPLAVANSDECCRLCAATTGCQFWWFMHYIDSLECNMYGLQNGPVTVASYTKAQGGILTSGSNAAAVLTDGCGSSVYVLKGAEFVSVSPSADPKAFPTSQMQAPNAPKFVNGARVDSWQACCKQARLFGLTYWSFGSDKKCVFVRRMSFNGESMFEIRKAGGAVSGIIDNGEVNPL